MGSIFYAVIYTILVFAIGFGLGVVRNIHIVPKIGKFYAVLLELPFIIGASFLIASFLNSQIFAPNRIFISIFSLIFLIIIEFLFAHFMFKMSLSKFLNKYKKADGQLGLFGQICFALLPLIIR